MIQTPSAPRGRLELLIFTWSGEPQRYRLPVVGQVRIGRDPRKNDICIQDPTVSGNHAILTVDSVIRIEDIGSTNGTVLRKGDKDVEVTRTERPPDGQRPAGQAFVVEPGDRLRFGSVMAMVRMVQLPSNSNAGDGGTWPYPPVVRHPAMQAVYDEARTIARSSSRACILLLGETGVGKDVLARAIHAASPRQKGPFVAVNAGAISEAMFLSEMFGHVKSAFTDAKADKVGFFEAADGGTLFLDEIGEIKWPCQIMLLRVLDDRRVMRVGSTQSKLVNVRVIAATNQKLEEGVTQGTFRKDLYHRLRGFELEIPPLRSRPADIVPLAEAFVEDECRAIEQRYVPSLSPQVVALLEGYEFSGNVRELRAAMMHAVAHCQGQEILVEHLPRDMRENDKTDPMVSLPFAVPEVVVEDASVEERIRWALDQTGGNARRAAELLGKSPRWIFNKLKMMDVPRPRRGAGVTHAKN
jgi:two-component system, NtrC family, response regulator AtoC